MIVFTASTEADALVAAKVRSTGHRWMGVFRKGSVFNVHADVYPADKDTRKVAVFVNGTQRDCSA